MGISELLALVRPRLPPPVSATHSWVWSLLGRYWGSFSIYLCTSRGDQVISRRAITLGWRMFLMSPRLRPTVSATYGEARSLLGQHWDGFTFCFCSLHLMHLT